MLNSEKNIYVNETEVKPNRYAIYILLMSVAGVVACWVLNEMDIFHVGKTEMRIGSIVPLAAIAIPLFVLIFKKEYLSNPKTKYIVMSAAIVVAITVNTLLMFHATLMLMYPAFIAMLYRSKRLGKMALIGTMLCTVISPILSYLIGTWDIDLLRELILIGTNGKAEVIGAYSGKTLLNVGKILLYLVGPRCIIVSSCSVLIFYVINIGVKHVNIQAEIDRLRRRDVLTGLYNQNYYKELLLNNKLTGKAGVIFFDINDLKIANDTFGHEYGDLLIQKCAKSISDVCDNEITHGFRIGGDEFLIIIEGANEAAVEEKLSAWNAALDKINRENAEYNNGMNCSMAYGFTVGDFKELEDLVHMADLLMYKNKSEAKKIS